MNLLVIGKNSILCKFFIKHTSIKTIDVFSYRDISKINFKKYTHIVNFSYNPKLRSERYSEKYDIDLKIAKYLTKKTIYVMLSSRYVYNHSNSIPFLENSQRKGMNIYGKNKIIVENKLKYILKKRLLILRIGTFLYYSLEKKDLFINILLNKLKKYHKIVFDLNKNIIKDFLTDIFFVKNLDILLKNNIVGIFNLSSGIAIKPTLIATRIIEGYREGKIEFSRYRKKDRSFVLNTKKLFKITNIKTCKKEILEFARKIGNRLKNE